MQEDDAAAFPVLEAILAATLIFGVLIFFTFASRPAQVAPQADALTPVAQGIASILVDANIGAKIAPSASDATNGWLEGLAKSDGPTRTSVTAFMLPLLPPGDHYVLRLHNGFGALDLSNDAGSPPPGATVGVGGAVVVPTWLPAGSPTEIAIPGTTVTVPAGTSCIAAPNGRSTTPMGIAWQSSGYFVVTATSATVPASAPFGVWSTSLNPNCTPLTASFRIEPDPTVTSQVLPYSLQVVVWHA